MKRKKTVETAKLKPLSEILGLSFEEETGEGSEADEESEIDEFTDSFRLINDALDLSDSLFSFDDEIKNDPEKLEDAEAIYELKLALLGRMVRTFHPLSEYGRAKLAAIKKCSGEFSQLAGPLVTNITRENAEEFSAVLPPDLREDVSVGRYKAIGALRMNEGSNNGAGALVYSVETSPLTDSRIIRILWLFVNEDFRHRGIANHLLAEIIGSMADLGITTMTITTPAGDGSERLKAYIMSSWGFELTSSINPDTMIRVKDMTSYSKIRKLRKGVRPLSEIGEGINRHSVKNAMKRFGCPGYLFSEDLPADYFDPDLSCYAGNESRITALLLAHILPSGTIRVSFIGSKKDREEKKHSLLSYFIEKAVIKAKDDTILYFPVDTAETDSFLDSVCPSQMGQYLLEGILTAPAEGADIDMESAEALAHSEN